MESDWYRTKRAGTYLVLKSGLPLVPVLLDPAMNGLIEDVHQHPFITRLESNSIAEAIHVYGVNDCLKLRGYCVVRSSTPIDLPGIESPRTAA